MAPPGRDTRPTADRVRQALFDSLLHAPWGGRDAIEGARVLDAFAGTGALGLEALSRGARHATFFDTDRVALAAVRANAASLGADDRVTVLAADATRPPPAPVACGVVFLDPPYRQGLVPRALRALAAAGWFAPEALVVTETAADEPPPAGAGSPLAERRQGAALIAIWRWPGGVQNGSGAVGKGCGVS